MLQTKIPFEVRKRLIPSPLSKKVSEKENCCKNKVITSPLKSPMKRNERSEQFILKVNSPNKRTYTNSIVNCTSSDDVSPAKRDRSITTPSSLLKKLIVTSPASKTSSKKELFPTSGGGDMKRNLKEAVRALHSTAPASLPCRGDNLSVLRTFLETHSNDETSGSIYISGPPGTGKTASLNLLLSDVQLSSKFKTINVNCTMVKSSMSLYNRVAEELKLKVVPKNEKTFLKVFEKYITTCQKMVLLVLDELDQLESRKQSLLYTVFEWPSLKQSRLVLIGIANALDLTDRVLPRLQAKVQLKPQLLHFPPYNRTQIVEIITNRLSEAGVDKVFPSTALQLLASKVAAVSGDVRRALDTARRVLEVSLNQSANLDGKCSLADTVNEEIVVTAKHVIDVVNNVYGTTQTLNSTDESDNVDSFPLQQKLLICCILLKLKEGKLKDVTVGKLHEVYCKVCDKRNIVAVDLSEFISITNLVETRGILRLQGKVKNRLTKISLQWDEKEMINALKDKRLLSSILEDKSGFIR